MNTTRCVLVRYTADTGRLYDSDGDRLGRVVLEGGRWIGKGVSVYAGEPIEIKGRRWETPWGERRRVLEALGLRVAKPIKVKGPHL